MERYLSGILVYSLAFFLYTHHNYYINLLREETVVVLRVLYISYVVGGFPFLLFSEKEDKHKPQELIKAVRDLLRVFVSFSVSFLPGKTRKKFRLDSEYKKIVLFTLVKVFYVPLMLNFLFGNWQGVLRYWEKWNSMGFSFEFREDYLFLLSSIFVLDTLVFCFGYLVEFKALKNVVKSVEPTLLGWVVALASYPPFSGVTGQYLSWYSSDRFFFSNELVDIAAKVAVLLLLCLYLWASFSLGPKASNLTNRGIVTSGAYRIVRHPAYIGKVSAWWIMALPTFSVGAVLSLAGWTIVYYLRAITEERHLINDGDYRKYVKKTRFRFVPGIM